MKKLLGAIATIAVTAATSAFADDIKIGLSVDQLFESRVAVNNGIKAEASDRGFEVVEVVADGDAQQQNAQIQSLITQQVDAILVCAVDQNTIERALMAAKRRAFPLWPMTATCLTAVWFRHLSAPTPPLTGRLAGEFTAEALADVEGEKVIVELIGALNDQNGIDRSKGFREGIASLDNVRLVEVPTDWDSARALSGTQNAFQANPEVHAVFAATDTHIPAVETVLTDAGKLHKVGEEGHVVVTGVNGSNDGYQAVLKGVADGFVVMGTEATGRKAVELVADIFDGKDVERVNVIPGCVLHR